MGSEAVCTARFAGKNAKGKALLETEELLFRAASGPFRLKIPFRGLHSVTASDGELRIKFDDGQAVLELGDLAAKWAQKILHPKTLIDKLGVKAAASVCVTGINDENFLEQVRRRTNKIVIGKPQKDSDLIFLGVQSPGELNKIPSLAKFLKKNAGLWIVYPKGQKAITESNVLSAGKAAGLVDVKVASFSPTHTALKFVIPLSRR